MNRRNLVVTLLTLFLVQGYGFSKKKTQPNVVIVLTDDQGIGDLSCHGNPWLKTPHLDKLQQEAVRLTDFHVSPYCAPSRSAIMTGRYPVRNGVWATYKGRDALTTRSTTMAQVFKQNGYKTGMFGKWHMGDNYPVRPCDVGFEHVVQHKAGGVGELSDYWGNSYFDDTYFVNNKPTEFEGYCTDVWFSETQKFIKENADKPFFVYLATNAPHSPWIVDEKYSTPYKKFEEDGKIVSSNFYGMIANLDENMGKLDKFLKKEKVLDNTIFIFLTDNGSSGGISRNGKIGYNKGFRGMKGGKTEGGHRVPFFIRWPNGKIEGGKDVNELIAHIDILPTLATLCDLELPKEALIDGIDFSSVLLEKNRELDNRNVFVHHRQDWRPPTKEKATCIMNKNWRLVNGNELYDVEKDPYEKDNVAKQYPDMVKAMLNANDRFYMLTEQMSDYHEFPVSTVGNSAQKEIKLTIQHAIGEGRGIWKSEQVSEGMRNVNNTHSIEILEDGLYEIECCRWPKECPGPMWGMPSYNPKNMYNYTKIFPKKVRISVENQIIEKEIQGDETGVVFTVHLHKGKTLLTNDFIEGKDKYGVYYTYVRRHE